MEQSLLPVLHALREEEEGKGFSGSAAGRQRGRRRLEEDLETMFQHTKKMHCLLTLHYSLSASCL